ncbi:uncharacterized protein LOC100892229 isoform X3 [Strongylocentrotus purpuratus]|uniref:AB hydrolase-1 domain-containing protein n=1 Tax=Strongylocentrotus purpuratus TaxID=7668 RepID=A0A7M7P4T2_STRPU|nr:uncharacterized protein LOC100892229 isoform X3 [Strongylocentrotus purpuratus]
MSRSIAANRVFNTFRIFSRSVCSADQLTQSRHSQRLFKMETSTGGERQMSTEEPRRFARPDEVDYALKQDMGQGYTRRTVQISALGTKYNMVYGEWVPVDRPVEGCPAVICIHGTPATEGAFRPIGSRIASGGYRVLAVNFPGMGYTEIDPERRYNHTTPDKAELVKGFITALRLESVAMVIGHSLGGHVVGKLSADPDLEGIVQSACFLCGTGVTPHRLYKKINSPVVSHLMYKMMYLPYIGWMVMYFFAQIVRRWGFRGRTHESQALCIYEVAGMNFEMDAET